MKNKSIEIIKGILILGSYFILPSIIAIPFFNLKSESLKYLLLYFSLLLFYSYIYRKDLIKDFKNFKPSYLKKAIKYWLIGLFFMVLVSNILQYSGVNIASNQQSNIDILNKMPIVETILAIFFSPIIEELVFRKSLYKAINNKHLFAIITGLIFGATHVIFSYNSPIELLYILSYAPCGIAFGYIYKETDNIYSTIIIHSLHNAISLLLLII